MLTIGQLAKRYSLSRSTLIYYDKMGLLIPSGRSHSNYRLYSENDIQRMEKILLFRNAGLSLGSILAIIDQKDNNFKSALENRLSEINKEIQNLRNQQNTVINILGNKELAKTSRLLTKEIWVSILKSSGLDREGRRKWHIEFEKSSPEAHQDFLESLGIEESEIALIRNTSI